MRRERHFYLIKLQYLGYRLHGWQRQPGLKTVEGMVKKTLKFMLPDRICKTLAAGRTDAMVSANEAAFEMFLDGAPLENTDEFLEIFNRNLPADIRALSIEVVDATFNVIQDSTSKEYLYLFSFGKKNHPFAAPLMANFEGQLDLLLMTEGAKLFEGFHSFHNYCTKPSEKTILERKIDTCELTDNTFFTANFFPEQSFMLKIVGAGFLRNQIRLMMGGLVLLGRGEMSLDQFQDALKPEVIAPITFIAPGSGLILNKVDFD